MIAKAGKELGYIVEQMPKFIDFEKCRLCGKCINGCIFDAKMGRDIFCSGSIGA